MPNPSAATQSEFGMHYVLILPVRAYPLGPNEFAVESAFAAHLD
ncbi:MAG: hypothetical protein R3A47_05115 [Polyangiales bacterium]